MRRHARTAAAAAVTKAGGGVLLVPPGVYKTGSFNISSHTTLRLAGGIVSGITPGSMATAHWDYPLLPWQHTGGSDACVACCASLALSVPSPPSLLSSLTTAWHGPTLIIRPCLPLSLVALTLSTLSGSSGQPVCNHCRVSTHVSCNATSLLRGAHTAQQR